MALTATPVFPQLPAQWTAVLINGTGAYTFAVGNTTTNLVSVCAGATNGSLIEAITVSTTDTSPNSLVLLISNGANLLHLTTLTLAATAGFAVGVPPVNVLTVSQAPGLAKDSNGNPFIYIPSGSTLYAGTLAVVTSAKQVSIIATGATF